jgi:hypothetical protein
MDVHGCVPSVQRENTEESISRRVRWDIDTGGMQPMRSQVVDVSVHNPNKHVLSVKRTEYVSFSSLSIDALDLENRRIPATIVYDLSTSACLINIWRDMYVYEFFEFEKDCPSVLGDFRVHTTAIFGRDNVRYCNGYPGTSVFVLPMCGCEDRCTMKSSKIYAILQCRFRSKYVISFDTVAARAYWSDSRCVSEPLVDVVSGVFFDWILRYGEERFNEDVMYEWINLDPFRICNGQILKMVTKDEMVSALLKALWGCINA